ncbi:hypothetical protein RZJ34_004380 [Escherichia coli]|nr:hypothetical protein [Escherichia coli]
MPGSAFAVTHHAFSSGAGRTSDGNGSHASTLKSPSYTKSVSWQHYPLTLPIGFITVEPERLELLKNLIIKRVEGAVATISWSESKPENLTSLLPVELLIKLDKKSGGDVEAAINQMKIANRAETARAILSLRKKP